MDSLYTTVEEVALKSASHSAVYYHLALRHASKKQYQRAIDSLKKALACADCDRKTVLMMIANMNYWKGAYVQALEACDQLEINLPTVLVQLILCRGKCLTKLGKYEEARKCFEEALAGDRNNAAVYVELGEMQRLSGDIAAAQQSFGHAFQLDPVNSHAVLGMGQCWTTKGDYTKALACFEQSLAIDTQYTEAWLEKGKCLQRLGRQKQATSCYKRLLLLDGSMRGRLEDIGVRTEGLAEDSVIQEQDQPEDLFKSSTELRRQGKYPQALRCINRAIKMMPDEPMYLCNRSLIHSKMGNDRLARDDLLAAADLFAMGASRRQNVGHKTLRDVTQEYAQLLTRAEDTKTANPRQEQQLKVIRDSANVTFNRNIQQLFEPSAQINEGMLQQLMREMNAMKEQLSRIEAENKSMKTKIHQHQKRIDVLERQVEEVLLPMKDRIFPQIQIDLKLERMRKEDPKRFYYVTGLHQCLNCYVQSMRLVLSGLFKVQNPHDNVFALTVIKGVLGLSKHIPVVGELLQAIGQLFLVAVQYRNQQKFKETQAKFNRLTKPFPTEDKISYEILEAVIWLSGRPGKAVQIRDVVTYIKVDRRNHVGKAVAEKAKNTFAKIKEEINGRILYIHEREEGITKDEYSLTLVSTQDLLFFLEYVFLTDLSELPSLKEIIRNKMCELTPEELQEIERDKEDSTPLDSPTKLESHIKSGLDQASVVLLRNFKTGEFVSHSIDGMLRLVKDKGNSKRWSAVRCKNNEQLYTLERTNKRAYLVENPNHEVILKSLKEGLQVKATIWRICKKTVSQARGFIIQSVDSGLFLTNKVPVKKKRLFGFCYGNKDIAEATVQLQPWKDSVEYLWDIVDSPEDGEHSEYMLTPNN